MNFVVKVRTSCNTGVSDCSDYLTLRNSLSLAYTYSCHMCIACINTVLMLYDNVVSEAVVITYCNNLTVCRSNNWVTASPCTKVKSFVNVPLLCNRVNILAEFHGNMAYSVLYRPHIGNVCKKRTLVFKHFSNLLYRVNCTFKISGKLSYICSFLK